MDSYRIRTAASDEVKIHTRYTKNPYIHKELVYGVRCIAADSAVHQYNITQFMSILEEEEHHFGFQQEVPYAILVE